MENKLKDSILFSFDVFLSLFFVFILSLFVTNYSFIFKSGISNLTIQGEIFIFCLFVRWFVDKESFSDSMLVKRLRYLIKVNDGRLLVLISVLLFLILFFIGVMRHFAFSSAGIDLGVSDQALWNTIKGRVLFSSLDGNISHLGAHFEPVYFLIAPLYFVWPNIIILIFLQAFAIGLAVFPLYLIAKERLNSRFLVFAFVFAYFLSRPLRGIGLLDFHTDVFLIPLAFASYYLLITKRNFLAVIAMLLMLCCKENAAMLVFAYGIFTTITLRRYRLGIVLVVLSVTWWVTATNYIMPYFAHTQSYPYLKWLPFGATYTDNILAVIRNPMLLVNLFFSGGELSLYTKLFLPLGMLSFLAPSHYVLFLMPLALQVIGSVNHGGMMTLTSHYPAHTLPFIFISAIYGVGRLVEFLNLKVAKKYKRWIEKFPVMVGSFIIICSLAFFGKSDGHKLAKFFYSARDLHSSEVRQALKIISQEASVSAVHRLVPHLTHRKFIYIWETTPETRFLVEYVVLHRRLIEKEGERFDQFITELKDKGFREIYRDRGSDLVILFNPHYKESNLESRQSRLISI